MGVLDEILAHKSAELADRRTARPLSELIAACRAQPPARDFEAAVRPRPGHRVRLIAEVKRASPSQGVIDSSLDPVAQARLYDAAGAAAVSVLTDEKYFRGRLQDLEAVRAAIGVPVLRKEFIVDEYQLWESRAVGADAVLLIATALDASALRGLVHAAREIGLAPLVEVHAHAELEQAIGAGASVIGVNNRDLQTLRTSLDPSLALIPLIPPGIAAVSESGISTRADVERVVAAGAHAILVGEALMRSADVAGKVSELLLEERDIPRVAQSRASGG